MESHECHWLTEGYWAQQPWAASVSVDIFWFSESPRASTAFEDERTDFYKDALRILDFGDELCRSNPIGDDYGYAYVMFRADNLLVQAS